VAKVLAKARAGIATLTGGFSDAAQLASIDEAWWRKEPAARCTLAFVGASGEAEHQHKGRYRRHGDGISRQFEKVVAVHAWTSSPDSFNSRGRDARAMP
jgi:hypothetical protein